ncbi:MAG TPA: hypothetical protein VN698_06570 [Bacteroidia bacterium]|nr:hypothetical protein [Bacteroidia bacterium]
MKKVLASTLLAALFLVGNPFKANAQCDTIASVCAKHIIASFISDGQQYRSLLLNPDETAEFKTTFFGETVYRVAACSGLTDGNLIFNIYDQDRNIIFSNKDYKNAPYWDFKTKSTVEVTIEAKLDPTNSGSGCAVLLIGFKQSKK